MAHELGRYIRRVRKERKLKLRHVANAVGKSVQYINDLELGRRGSGISPILVIRLAEYLNVPVSAMLHAAGIEYHEDSEEYRKYFKLARNSIRAHRLKTNMDAVKELLSEARLATQGQPTLKSLVKSLEIAVNELESTLTVG